MRVPRDTPIHCRTQRSQPHDSSAHQRPRSAQHTHTHNVRQARPAAPQSVQRPTAGRAKDVAERTVMRSVTRGCCCHPTNAVTQPAPPRRRLRARPATILTLPRHCQPRLTPHQSRLCHSTRCCTALISSSPASSQTALRDGCRRSVYHSAHVRLNPVSFHYPLFSHTRIIRACGRHSCRRVPVNAFLLS